VKRISVIEIIGLILVTMVSKFAIGLSNVLIVPYEIKSLDLIITGLEMAYLV